MNDNGQSDIKQFLEFIEKERRYSLHTIDAYRRDLEKFNSFLTDEIGESFTSYKVVDNYKIKDFKKIILKFFNKEIENGRSSKTRARRLSTIKAFFKFLIQENILTNNPAMYVSSPKIEKRLPIVIQKKRIKSLMKQPKIQDGKLKKDNKKSRKDSRIRLLRNTAILELFYATGIRLSELVNLNIGSINENEMLLKVMGKGQKERIVPFGKPAKIALKAYLKKRNLNFQSSPEIPLFCSWHENRIGVRRVQVILEDYLAVVLGSEDNYSRVGANPHTLRHTFATHLLEENVDIRLIQELLGHSSLSSTQIYTNVDTKKMIEIYKDKH
ncbi:uncharacterized protein METZ01_LOCUS317157, partial [marine metagenome]